MALPAKLKSHPFSVIGRLCGNYWTVNLAAITGRKVILGFVQMPLSNNELTPPTET